VPSSNGPSVSTSSIGETCCSVLVGTGWGGAVLCAWKSKRNVLRGGEHSNRISTCMIYINEVGNCCACERIDKSSNFLCA